MSEEKKEIDYTLDDGLSDEGFKRAAEQLAPIFSEIDLSPEELEREKNFQESCVKAREILGETDGAGIGSAEGEKKALDVFMDIDKECGGPPEDTVLGGRTICS